jgi:hypothetical protein
MRALLLCVAACGCSLQSNALLPDTDGSASETGVAESGLPDGAPDGIVPDVGMPDTEVLADSSMPDTAMDAPTDTAACVPVDEVCNGADDDCDLEIDEAGCDCERELFGGHVYLFCTSGRSFADAETDCADWGYHLVFIESADEQGFVWSRASGRIVTDWWLGLSDRTTEGRYEWTDGTVVWEGGAVASYHAFRGGSPDDTSGENCFELDSAAGEWGGAGCSQAQPYVCEAP